MRHPPRRRRFRVLLSLTLLLPAGCYRRVAYTSPDGRTVEVLNVGFDTHIGRLHAETSQGSVTIENADSRAAALADLLDLAESLKGGAR